MKTNEKETLKKVKASINNDELGKAKNIIVSFCDNENLHRKRELVRLDKNCSLYRIVGDKTYTGMPPKGVATLGRMNTPDQPLLYTASSEEVAKEEVDEEYADKYLVTYKPKRDLNVIVPFYDDTISKHSTPEDNLLNDILKIESKHKDKSFKQNLYKITNWILNCMRASNPNADGVFYYSTKAIPQQNLSLLNELNVDKNPFCAFSNVALFNDDSVKQIGDIKLVTEKDKADNKSPIGQIKHL